MNNMKLWKLLILIFLVKFNSTQEINNELFPEDFLFGIATSAFQIEGAWNEDGKNASIWDTYVHNNPSKVSDGSNADVASDSYHKWREDVQLLVDLGVHFYRFSISWSRILPGGFTKTINTAGVTYYQNLIIELKNNNITPLVTMYHWDLPQNIQDAGGWTNEKIIDWFLNYAKTLFDLFGDDVKHWVTFNEPISVCQSGYGSATKAPGLYSNGIGDYICAHNLLKAHAKVWHLYDTFYRCKQEGQVGIVLDIAWFQAATNSTEDETAAQTARQFYFGWFAHPLIKGNYPKVMREHIDRRSKAGNYTCSRLPKFTWAEVSYLKGTIDFLGVNVYTSYLTAHLASPTVSTPGWLYDVEIAAYQPSTWQTSSASWLKVTPWAIGNVTKWVQQNYNDPIIIITENGFADDGILEDDARVNFHKTYLSSLRTAISEGVKVIGYTAWSLLDNFEWMSGYTEKFGLYYVNFTDPSRTRTAKKSAEYYKKVIQTRCLVDECVN